MTLTAILDFETTGLSPAQGDRATEVAIVLMEGERVVDRFQSLMNAGVRLSPFIESYTGITNAMVAAAPPAARVMADAARFVGAAPLVAHNAAFDRRFWAAELARAGVGCGGGSCSDASTGGAAAAAPPPFACTLLLSRRLYPEAPGHSLGSLAAFHALPSAGRAHRALADAEVTAALLARIRRDIGRRFGIGEPAHALLMQLQAAPRAQAQRVVERHLAQAAR